MYIKRSRISQLIKGMLTRSVQTAIITNPVDIFYYTGFLPHSWDMSALIVTDSEETHLIIPYSEYNRKLPNVDEIHVYSDYKITMNEDKIKNFEYVLLEILKDHEERTIGYQKYNVPIAFRDFMITKVMPDNEIDISETIWSSRQIKDLEEIQHIKEASEKAEIGMRTAIEIIRPGETEKNYAIEIENVIKKLGVEQSEVNIISGERTARSYQASSIKKIKKDEPVIIDIVVAKDHYYSRITRTIHTGTPEKRQKEVFKILNTTITKIEEYAKSELAIREIDLNIRRNLSVEGLDKKAPHRTGNSIGLELIERPFIDSESKDKLKENMILIINPAIYLENFGIQISNLFRVTSNGIENLVKIGKNIFTL